MNVRERELHWSRLVALLEPVHGPALATARRLCRTSADGDDLYAEAVLRAFDKLHTLRDESRFRSWFFATMLSRHRSRSRLRFWRRFVPLDEAFPAGAEPVGEDGSSWADDRWRAERVAAGLATLPAVQREALVLFELDAYSIEEIAVMQSASIAAVKSRLTRGRERLRFFYERHGTTEQRVRASRTSNGIVADPESPAEETTRTAHVRLAAAAYGLEKEKGPHD